MYIFESFVSYAACVHISVCKRPRAWHSPIADDGLVASVCLSCVMPETSSSFWRLCTVSAELQASALVQLLDRGSELFLFWGEQASSPKNEEEA